jgi:hypothetical protein
VESSTNIDLPIDLHGWIFRHAQAPMPAPPDGQHVALGPRRPPPPHDAIIGANICDAIPMRLPARSGARKA